MTPGFIPLANQASLTKESILANSPQLLKVYGGKYRPTPFVATGPDDQENTVSSIFKKAKDLLNPANEWVGKVGLPAGSLRHDREAIFYRSESNINGDTIREKIAIDLYGEFGRGAFTIPKTHLSSQPVEDDHVTNYDLVNEWIGLGIQSSLRILSRKVAGYTPFDEAKTVDEHGKPIPFMVHIRQNHCLPNTLQTSLGAIVPLYGLLELLAIGKVLADPNCLGESAGFRWVYDDAGEIIAAKVVKLDAGSAFQFQNNPPDTDPTNEVQWSTLSHLQKDAFISTLLVCSRYLSPELLPFLCYREGQFQELPQAIAGQMAQNISARIEQLLNIYQEEIVYHLVRRLYLEKHSRLPLPMSEESFPIRDLFTTLVLVDGQERVNRYERLIQLRKTLGINQLFSRSTQVLLVGRAGSGKSTLCQKIAHGWAAEELFQGCFSAVYLLPLRQLNAAMEEGGFLHDITDPIQFLAKAIAHFLLEDEAFTPYLLNQIQSNPDKNLIILDGYDEATFALCQAIQLVLEKEPLPILLTSRPGVTEAIELHMEQIVENIGFSANHIKDYSTHFFYRKRRDSDSQVKLEGFLQALKNSPHLFAIAHVPLQLQMLCNLWEQGAHKVGFASSLTELYQTMVEQLFHWECRRKRIDPKTIPEDHKKRLFSLLGTIAGNGLATGRLMIPQQTVIACLDETQFSEQDLLESGLLKMTGSGIQIHYHFLHPTFQEYMAAYQISYQLPIEQTAFIQAKRDQPAYALVLAFLAGMVYQRDASPTKTLVQDFFESLCQEAALVGSPPTTQKVELLLKCLQECGGIPKDLPQVKALLENYLIYSNSQSESRYSPLADVLQSALTQNQHHAFQWILNNIGQDLEQSDAEYLFYESIRQGNLQILQILYKHNPALIETTLGLSQSDGYWGLYCWHVNPLCVAVFYGHFELVKWLYKCRPSLLIIDEHKNLSATECALRFSQLNIFLWLSKSSPDSFHPEPCHYRDAMLSASERGCLEMMKWLYKQHAELFQPIEDAMHVMLNLVKFGYLEVIQWLDEKDFRLIRIAGDLHQIRFQNAGSCGLGVKWLDKNNPNFIEEAKESENLHCPPIAVDLMLMHNAAESGQLEVMKWLDKKYPNLTRTTEVLFDLIYYCAANCGQIEVMKWLQQKDPTLLQKTLEEVGMSSRRYYGCWSSEETPMDLLARRERYFDKVIKWLYVDPTLLQKCTIYFKEKLLDYLVRKNSLHDLKRLFAQDPALIRIVFSKGNTLMHEAVAAKEDRIEMIKWLHRQDPTMVKTMNTDKRTPMSLLLKKYNYSLIIEWLHEDPSLPVQTLEYWDRKRLSESVRLGNKQMAQWLYEQDRTCIANEDEMIFAIEKQDLKTMKWLEERFPCTICLEPASKYEKKSAAMRIASQKNSLQNFEIFEWIYQIDPKAIKEKDYDGSTLMDKAVLSGNINIIQFLYEKKSDLLNLKKVNEVQETLMHHAAGQGHLEVVEWLYKKDPTLIHQFDLWDNTPMHFAARGEHFSVMNWLHTKNPKLLHQMNKHKETPMRILAMKEGKIQQLYSEYPEIVSNYWKPADHNYDDYGVSYIFANREIDLVGVFDWFKNNDYSLMHEAVGEEKAESIIEYYQQEDPTLIYQREPQWGNSLIFSVFRSSVFRVCGRSHILKIMKVLQKKDKSLITQRNLWNQTAMHITFKKFISRGDKFADWIDCLEWLHAQDSTMISKTDDEGQTVMHVVCSSYIDHFSSTLRERLKAVQWLHQHDKSLIHKRSHSASVLEMAVANCDLDLIQWLYEQDPSLIQKTKAKGGSPLLPLLSLTSTTDMGHGYDPDDFYSEDKERIRKSVMHYFAGKGNLHLMRCLHEQNPTLIKQKDLCGNTPMHIAALRGHIEIMFWLFEQDPTVTEELDQAGKTPMQIAARGGILPKLYSHYPYMVDESWLTFPHTSYPVHQAAHQSQFNGKLMMNYAATKGFLEPMKHLHRYDSNLIDQRTIEGKTLMHLAAKAGNLHIVEWLNSQDPTLMQRATELGETVMYEAALGGCLDTLKWLAAQNCSLMQEITHDGNTIMHAAAQSGKVDVMQWIYVQAPNLLKIVDNNGWTVMDVSSAYGHKGAMQWCNNHYKDVDDIGYSKNELSYPKPSPSPAIANLVEVVKGSMGQSSGQNLQTNNNNYDTDNVLAKKEVVPEPSVPLKPKKVNSSPVEGGARLADSCMAAQKGRANLPKINRRKPTTSRHLQQPASQIILEPTLQPEPEWVKPPNWDSLSLKMKELTEMLHKKLGKSPKLPERTDEV